MEDREYFLQHKIENLSVILNGLIAKISSCSEVKEILEGFEQINREMMGSLNIKLDEIANISLDHFIATLTVDNIIDNHNLELLAELFYHSGKAFQKLNDKEMAKRMLHRSLIIFRFLLKIEIDFPYERHLRIKELSELLLQ